MDKIKKRLIKDVLGDHGLNDRGLYECIYAIETITDSEYKSSGGVIGEFETWASVYSHDKMYRIFHTNSEFVVRPLETKVVNEYGL